MCSEFSLKNVFRKTNRINVGRVFWSINDTVPKLQICCHAFSREIYPCATVEVTLYWYGTTGSGEVGRSQQQIISELPLLKIDLITGRRRAIRRLLYVQSVPLTRRVLASCVLVLLIQ